MLIRLPQPSHRWFIAAILFALTACDTTATATELSQPVVSPPAAPITLTVWHAARGVNAATLNALAEDFHTAYPTIILQTVPKSSEGELMRQAIAALALNQPPDLIIASNRTIFEFARSDTLAPLDAYLNDPARGLSENERADFFPGLIDTGRFQKQLVAFPFDLRAVVLYYNADLLKAAKMDAPPRTWDQFSNAARGTTKGAVRGWAMTPNAFVFYAFQFSRGSTILNDAQTQAQFGDDAGMKSLQMIVALDKGGAAYLAGSADAAQNDFAQGKTALLFGTTDQLPALADALARAGANFQWGIANVPQNDPAKATATVFGTNVAIFKTSDERARAAWLFARWLAQPEQTARWSRAANALPVRASARPLLAADATANPMLQRLRDSIGDPLPTARAVPAVKDAAKIDEAIVEMGMAVANNADIAGALNQATTRVNRLLGQTP